MIESKIIVERFNAVPCSGDTFGRDVRNAHRNKEVFPLARGCDEEGMSRC